MHLAAVWRSAHHLPMPALTLDHWRAAARFLDFEGHRIAYWTAGSGRPLLLVHGFPTSSWDWHRVWEPLAARHTLVACDLLGFGLSDKPRSGYSIHRQADLQASLLARLGLDDCDALVHDYGVSVGQELLARQTDGALPFRIGRMLFLNGGLFPGLHRPRLIQKLGASPLGPLVSLLMNRRRFARSFVEVFGPHTRPSEAELDAFWALIAHGDGHRRTHALLGYMHDRVRHAARWVGALSATEVPLLLVNGGADPVSGAHVHAHWRQVLPQAGALLLPQIGHYPQTEAPAAVVEAALAFLGGSATG